ncbi:MAG: type I secretion C-terminal target domain-containing protein, partial [Halomonas sp.]|nr:type I secretion C-terminal target domain-containing protein [Halomonas sp.]
ITDNNGEEVINGEGETATIRGSIGEGGATLDSLVISDSQGNTLRLDPTSISVATDGSYTVTGIDVSGLADGELTVTATSTDVDGNTATRSDSVMLDTTPTVSTPDTNNDDDTVWESALTEGSGGGVTQTTGSLVIETGHDTLASLAVQNVAGQWIEITQDGTLIDGEYGMLSVNQDGSWTYTLGANTLDHSKTGQVGASDQVQDIFKVKVTDSDGDVSPEADLTIDINDDGPSWEQGSTSYTVAEQDIPKVLSGHYEFAGEASSSRLDMYGFTVTARGFKSSSDSGLVSANVGVNNGFVGVQSVASPYHNISSEVDYRLFGDEGKSEELVFTLDEGTVAYTLKIEFAMMFGGEKEVGVVDFYRDGKLVASKPFTSDASDGDYAAKFSMEDGGFDSFVLRATDNDVNNRSDNSDFSVKSVTFGEAENTVVIGYASGDVGVHYGADGYGTLDLVNVAGPWSIEVAASGNTLNAYNEQGELLFTVQLTPETGKWELYQYQPLVSNVAIDFLATDGDGDSVAGVIRVETLGYEIENIVANATAHTVGNSTQGTLASVGGLKQTNHNSAEVYESAGYYSVDHSGNNDVASAIEPIEALLFELTETVKSATFNVMGDVSGASYILYEADGDKIGGPHSLSSNGILDITSESPFAYVAFLGGTNDSGQSGNESSFSVKPVGIVVVGGDDPDLLIGSTGDDTLNGLEGSDTLIGGKGSDTLLGDKGNDVLSAGEGSDKLSGGDGADWLLSGAGNDTLTGGLGADTFAWQFGDESSADTPAVDTVTDFEFTDLANGDPGDSLDLTDLLQDYGSEGKEDLSSFIQATDEGSKTTLHISTQGGLSEDNANADQTIVLDGMTMNGQSSEAFIQSMINANQLDIDK